MDTQRRPSLLYLSMYDPHVPLTGAGTRGFQFVTTLSRQFDLDLVYMEGAGQKPEPGITQRFQDRINSVRSKTSIPFTSRGYFLHNSVLLDAARKKLAEHQHDWLLCDYGLAARYGLILAREFGVRTVYCSHNVEYRVYLDKAKGGSLLRWPLVPYVYTCEKRMVKKCDLLVAISKGDADVYAGWTGRSKILVIPQGFDESIFHATYSPPQNDRRVVLFCGNLGIGANRKGVQAIVDQVIDKVVERVPGTLFRFVGAHPPTDITHPNVEFTGFIEDYPQALQQADVVISPLMQGQGFPTKIVEALACGKPTISTPTGARAIDPDLKNLHVVQLEAFADKICEQLELNCPVDDRDMDRIRSLYSWEENIKRLSDAMLRFDEHCATPQSSAEAEAVSRLA